MLLAFPAEFEFIVQEHNTCFAVRAVLPFSSVLGLKSDFDILERKEGTSVSCSVCLCSLWPCFLTMFVLFTAKEPRCGLFISEHRVLSFVLKQVPSGLFLEGFI